MANEIYAIFDTTEGKFKVQLFADKTPKTVDNFVALAEGAKTGKPFYDGTIFHRVIPEFMIQGGDPAGTGSGPDPVKVFKNETSPDLTFDKAGRLAYANAGPGTNASQFFITEVPFTGQQAAMLNGNYTIFGQCDEASVSLVKQIERLKGHHEPSTRNLRNV